MFLLENMKSVLDEKRGARFVCAITLVDKNGVITARGECEGKIAYAPTGENGFGYDPVFFVEQFGKTMAEISPEEKNQISHRGKALEIFSKKFSKKEYK